MKNFSPTFLQTLYSGTRALSVCWQITLPGGTVLGFSDSDRPIVIDGITHDPDGGFRASDVDRSVENSADQITLESYFSEQITEAMILSGQLRGASVFIFQVDPRNLPSTLEDDPLTYNPLLRGRIAQVNRTDQIFTATVQGIHSRFGDRQGWQISPTCRNRFCDALCGLDIADYTNSATVESFTGNRIIVINFDFKDNEYTGGKLTWISGDNTDTETTIVYSNGRTLKLLDPALNPIQIGDQATIQRNCDKSFETCRVIYGNATKFNGEIGLPGDSVLGNPTQIEPG
jgi:uncharacterized phage protein (TIGR02218 family)